MKHKFNLLWNDHYDFSDSNNLAEIENVDSYDIYNDTAKYTKSQNVESPWGSNQVLDVWLENGIEYCKKSISINPKFMLSLQRHRGREETWKVLEGILTVIIDGKRHDISKGQSIFISKGAPHCMINVSDSPVVVEEIQVGICREADNIRLIDFSGRATYPLTRQKEYESSRIYLEIMRILRD